MSGDYEHGRAAGLAEAAEIVRRLEDAVAMRLLRPSGRRTRDARKVRCKAFSVAATRISTAAKAVDRKRRRPRGAKITSTLKELGL